MDFCFSRTLRLSQCVAGVDDPIERDNESEHAGLEASAFEEKSAV
jgi:hypothetical protein